MAIKRFSLSCCTLCESSINSDIVEKNMSKKNSILILVIILVCVGVAIVFFQNSSQKESDNLSQKVTGTDPSGAVVVDEKDAVQNNSQYAVSLSPEDADAFLDDMKNEKGIMGKIIEVKPMENGKMVVVVSGKVPDVTSMEKTSVHSEDGFVGIDLSLQKTVSIDFVVDSDKSVIVDGNTGENVGTDAIHSGNLISIESNTPIVSSSENRVVERLVLFGEFSPLFDPTEIE